jgi:hypothetical protein
MKVSKKLPSFMGYTILYAINELSYTNGKFSSLSQNVRDTMNANSGFVSIFNSPEPRVKFANAQGVALAITTGMLKEVVDAAVACKEIRNKNHMIFVLMDVIRYFEELGLKAIEFPAKKPFRSQVRQGDMSSWVPLSDRYQHDSWKSRLKMSYPTYDTSGGNLYPEGVTLAEANRL